MKGGASRATLNASKAEKSAFNAAPPPMTTYNAENALAVAATAVENGKVRCLAARFPYYVQMICNGLRSLEVAVDVLYIWLT